MIIKLSENIKTFRKERKMTQEQLAEALGVTVGAVYKWERELSTPDIVLIMELADLFGVSVDVLLGYEWKNGDAGAALDEIKRLSEKRDYSEASSKAEKSIKKYPNNFDIVYQSALMYLSKGESNHDEKAYSRAIELFEHACELISQNTDASISETSIRTQIAKTYLWLGNHEKALELLKKYNICGINNAFIGMILADFLHDNTESEKYLEKAVSSCLSDLDYAMIGYANVFFKNKDYDTTLDCIRWLRNAFRGIQPEEKLCYFDKYDCVLLETMAEVYCFKLEPENARKYIRMALEKAKKYDEHINEIKGVELYDRMRLDFQPAYDIYGETALDCLKRRISYGDRLEEDDEDIPYMLDIWKDEFKEVFPNEQL